MPFLRTLTAVIVALFCVLATAPRPWAQDSLVPASGDVVLTAAIEGPIGPATVRHVERVVALAESRQAAALVLRLNTPGGLADAMRQIVSSILGSSVPVIGYVAPSGAHAASAGTFILYATHVAAMAPGTNLGAATPVQIGGLPGPLPGGDREPGADAGPEDEAAPDGADGKRAPPADAMTAKATNDAVALIRSLAELHGRNADWAETAVTEAASLPASAALERNVIDLVAGDMAGLLAAVDGRRVELGGTERVLRVAGLPVEAVAMTTVTRILSVLSNPNVALILMMIGVYGLIFEFLNPGGVAPGVVGAICLTLGLYALNQLPLDLAGLALLAFGIGFMVAEAITPSFGVLGFGGLVAFVLGASMLVDTDVPAFQISWWMIAAVAALSAAVLILLIGVTLRSYRGKPVSGRAGLIGAEARVIEWSGTEGYVWLDGERWHATSRSDLAPGQTARVGEIDGLTLRLMRPGDGISRQDGKGAT